MNTPHTPAIPVPGAHKPTPKDVLEQTIGRTFERKQLTPPVFEIDRRTSYTPHIAYSQTVERQELGAVKK